MKPLPRRQRKVRFYMEPKLKRVMRIDSIPAADTSIDEQGFLHDTPIVTSTGIFEYILPDGTVRRELRLPKYVFDPESLKSYQGKPVIITHQAGSIDKDNVMDEIVGTILSEGFKDGDNVRCKIIIHDFDKVKKIPFRELSLGYDLDLIEEPGVWEGEHYDAIQTNIRINHLAIVEKARAGDKAHLNLDGKSKEGEDISRKGGKEEMLKKNEKDSINMTPEELMEAINFYKASKAKDPGDEGAPDEKAKDEGEELEAVDPEEKIIQDGVDPELTGGNEADENKDGGPGCIAKLIAATKELLRAVESEYGTGDMGMDGEACEDGSDCPKKDGSDDKSKSMNNDSSDIFLQKLKVCRVGDKLNLDGLEGKSLIDAKKAIVKKVLPEIRLDGKDDDYVNVAYDLAVGVASKRKGVAYQRKQMTGGNSNRLDSAVGTPNGSMAADSRKKMIEREGGNQ